MLSALHSSFGLWGAIENCIVPA